MKSKAYTSTISAKTFESKGMLPLLLLIVFFVFSCKQKPKKDTTKSELKNFAEQYLSIIVDEKNVEEFANMYGDSVYYSDPIWGVSEYVQRDTLKLWFQPVFHPITGWDFRIDICAIDEKASSFAFKGISVDKATHNERIITSWLTIKGGKIVEQTDFTPWSLESLKYSPRFEEALKNYKEVLE